MLALAQQSNILDFPAVAPQGKSNEWYTPSRYIEAAREVMGSIDLDPASCEMANRTVRARRYYTQAENGLMQPWYGNVWLNPPFGKDMTQPNEKRSGIHLWISRCVEEYRAGRVKQSIILATTRTDTPWFDLLWQYPVCFTNRTVQFHVPYKTKTWNGKVAHIHGTCFAYLGSNEQRFIDIFSQFGTIAKRVSQPRHTIAAPSLWEVAQ